MQRSQNALRHGACRVRGVRPPPSPSSLNGQVWRRALMRAQARMRAALVVLPDFGSDVQESVRARRREREERSAARCRSAGRCRRRRQEMGRVCPCSPEAQAQARARASRCRAALPRPARACASVYRVRMFMRQCASCPRSVCPPPAAAHRSFILAHRRSAQRGRRPPARGQ